MTVLMLNADESHDLFKDTLIHKLHAQNDYREYCFVNHRSLNQYSNVVESLSALGLSNQQCLFSFSNFIS